MLNFIIKKSNVDILKSLNKHIPNKVTLRVANYIHVSVGLDTATFTYSNCYSEIKNAFIFLSIKIDNLSKENGMFLIHKNDLFLKYDLKSDIHISVDENIITKNGVRIETIDIKEYPEIEDYDSYTFAGTIKDVDLMAHKAYVWRKFIKFNELIENLTYLKFSETSLQYTDTDGYHAGRCSVPASFSLEFLSLLKKLDYKICISKLVTNYLSLLKGTVEVHYFNKDQLNLNLVFLGDNISICLRADLCLRSVNLDSVIGYDHSNNLFYSNTFKFHLKKSEILPIIEKCNAIHDFYIFDFINGNIYTGVCSTPFNFNKHITESNKKCLYKQCHGETLINCIKTLDQEDITLLNAVSPLKQTIIYPGYGDFDINNFLVAMPRNLPDEN